MQRLFIKVERKELITSRSTEVVARHIGEALSDLREKSWGMMAFIGLRGRGKKNWREKEKAEHIQNRSSNWLPAQLSQANFTWSTLDVQTVCLDYTWAFRHLKAWIPLRQRSGSCVWSEFEPLDFGVFFIYGVWTSWTVTNVDQQRKTHSSSFILLPPPSMFAVAQLTCPDQQQIRDFSFMRIDLITLTFRF